MLDKVNNEGLVLLDQGAGSADAWTVAAWTSVLRWLIPWSPSHVSPGLEG